MRVRVVSESEIETVQAGPPPARDGRCTIDVNWPGYYVLAETTTYNLITNLDGSRSNVA
jgi:hypothetical protein